MNRTSNDPSSAAGSFGDYANRLAAIAAMTETRGIEELASELLDCWKTGRHVFLCGNGGSGANSVHMANDFIYSISKTAGSGLKTTALPANTAVVTCLANDEGYSEIFSLQLAVLAKPKDVLIVLSGSGNSQNILKALDTAKEMKMKTYALLGYSGGKAKSMADVSIHFAIDDMQISEDLQTMVLHSIMQWLARKSADVCGREMKMLAADSRVS
jgi:D-sedoheptulose 7-phosphate isomerase